MMTLNKTIARLIRYFHNGGIAQSFLSEPLSGDFVIDGSDISLSNDFEIGDWILISDSKQRLNGIYLIGEPNYPPITPPNKPLFSLYDGSTDDKPFDSPKSFSGAIYRLLLPFGFVETARKITEWQNDPANAPTLLRSESVFGAYSWSKGRNSASGGIDGWKEAFAGDLAAFPFVMFTLSLL